MKTRLLILLALATLSAYSQETKTITRAAQILAHVSEANQPKGREWSLPAAAAASAELKAVDGQPGEFRFRAGNPSLSGQGATLTGSSDKVRFHGVECSVHFECRFAQFATVQKIKGNDNVRVAGTLAGCEIRGGQLLNIRLVDCVLK